MRPANVGVDFKSLNKFTDYRAKILVTVTFGTLVLRVQIKLKFIHTN